MTNQGKYKTQELKPCPFCGNSDVFIDNEIFGNGNLGYVGCKKCRIVTQIMPISKAIEKWNRRVDK